MALSLRFARASWWLAECYNCCGNPAISNEDARQFPPRPQQSRGVAQPGRAPGSGPGGRRFKSSLPDQFSDFACLKITSNGFLYVGTRFTPSVVQFKSIDFSKPPRSAEFLVRYRE